MGRKQEPTEEAGISERLNRKFIADLQSAFKKKMTVSLHPDLSALEKYRVVATANLQSVQGRAAEGGKGHHERDEGISRFEELLTEK